MIENKRFKYVRNKYKHYIHDTEKDGEWKEGYIGTYGEFDLDKLTIELNKRENKINHLKNENEQLKQKNDVLTAKIDRILKQRDRNEEQTLKVMTYLHNKYYKLWEEVNRECFLI